jgi:hypothetical protein
MNQQEPKAVQSWADSKLVVSGSLCRLIDNKSQLNIFQFDTGSVLDTFAKCYSLKRLPMLTSHGSLQAN